MTIEEYKKLPKSKTEREIQAEICEYLTERGIPHTISDASRSGSKRQKVKIGWPDISGVIPKSGTALFIECKAPSGKLSPAQGVTLGRLKAAGAVVMVARSVDTVRLALEAYTGKEWKRDKSR